MNRQGWFGGCQTLCITVYNIVIYGTSYFMHNSVAWRQHGVAMVRRRERENRKKSIVFEAHKKYELASDASLMYPYIQYEYRYEYIMS